MARTPAQEQLEHLARLKKERGPARGARTAPASSVTAGGQAVDSIEPVARTRALSRNPKRRTLALPVRTEDFRALMLALRKDRTFKRKRDLADWVMTLLLQLPGKAHALPAEGQSELFQRMREWLRSRGVTG